MNAIGFKNWLEDRGATCSVMSRSGVVYCTITRGLDVLVDTESPDLEEAIRCAQHLYDAEVMRP